MRRIQLASGKKSPKTIYNVSESRQKGETTNLSHLIKRTRGQRQLKSSSLCDDILITTKISCNPSVLLVIVKKTGRRSWERRLGRVRKFKLTT